MKMTCLVAAILFLGSGRLIAQEVPVNPEVADQGGACVIQPKQLNALLALSVDKFDQDANGGWRELAHKRCEISAAMAIDAFVVDAPSRMTTRERENLSFHAGQLYAFVGLRELAARRLLHSIHLHETSASEELAWNPYVLATVAFMAGDRDEFLHQQQLLASARHTEGNKINLGVLDGLSRCFDKPYRTAYESCRTPSP